MYIALLGRQPKIGIAELESLYGSTAVEFFSSTSALVDTDAIDIEQLGGSFKAGKVIVQTRGNWRQLSSDIVSAYTTRLGSAEGKITLGISAYGFDVPGRDVQKTGILLKQALKKKGVSLRLIPNTDAALNTATSHHNKLGLSKNKIELIVVQSERGDVVVAESTGAQNITALARRDQERPKRDAFVGMLPPKLAQIMINLAAGRPGAQQPRRILDPFCGTGVVLQEAALMDYRVYGTDLADKMIDYSTANLAWLAQTHRLTIDATVAQGDAMTTVWTPPIDAVACESYLGQPFSAPPSPGKLADVRKNCNHIISTFLKNLHSQIKPGTPLCIAVPAWRDANGTFTHLPLIRQLDELGYAAVEFQTVQKNDLLYYREDQIVARELLVLRRI